MRIYKNYFALRFFLISKLTLKTHFYSVFLPPKALRRSLYGTHDNRTFHFGTDGSYPEAHLLIPEGPIAYTRRLNCSENHPPRPQVTSGPRLLDAFPTRGAPLIRSLKRSLGTTTGGT